MVREPAPRCAVTAELTCEPGQLSCELLRLSCHLASQLCTGHAEVCGSPTGSEVGKQCTWSRILTPPDGHGALGSKLPPS